MNGRLSSLLTQLALVALFVGFGIFAAPVKPNQNPQSAEGSTHRNPDVQYQQGFHSGGSHASASFVQEQHPLQAWLAEQSETLPQNNQQGWEPSSQSDLGAYYGSNSILDQTPIYDTTDSHYFWEGQQQPTPTWPPFNAYEYDQGMSSSPQWNEHQSLPVHNFQLPQVPTDFPQLYQGGHSSNYDYVDPQYHQVEIPSQSITETNTPSGVLPPPSLSSFVPSESHSGGSQFDYGLQHLQTFENYYLPEVFDRSSHSYSSSSQYSHLQQEDTGITPSASASDPSEDMEDNDAQLDAFVQAEDDLTEVNEEDIMDAIKHVQCHGAKWYWEQCLTRQERQRILGTIIARWITLKGPTGLPKDMYTPIADLRKALRLKWAKAILSKNVKAINFYATASLSKRRGQNLDLLDSKEKAKREFYLDHLTTTAKQANVQVVESIERERRNETARRGYRKRQSKKKGTGVYGKLDPSEKGNMSKAIQFHAGTGPQSNERKSMVEFLRDHMIDEDKSLIGRDLLRADQAYKQLHSRWQQWLSSQDSEQSNIHDNLVDNEE